MTTTPDRIYWREAEPRGRAVPEEQLRAPRELTSRVPAPDTPPLLSGGARARVSTDTTGIFLESLSSVALRTRVSAEEHWRGADLDSDTLSRISIDELTELLLELSPEISIALWQFNRFGNPGYEITAARPGGAMAGRGAHQDALKAFEKELEKYGGLGLVATRLLMGGLLRGGFVAELVLNRAGRVPLTIATPDPASLSWRSRTDEELGQVWVLGQQQATEWVPLERETIRYVPLDPLPGHPEGRAPVSPALFCSLFLLAMLHDLRRVVQQQGYPRIDVSVLMDNIRKVMPMALAGDPAKSTEYVNNVIASVQEAYSNLQPEDAYVHPDTVQVNQPVGTLDASSLGAVDGLIAAIERSLVRALKTAPVLMGVTEGMTDASVRYQWKIYAATLRAVQHPVEQILSSLLTLALQAQGVLAEVSFTFADSSIVDRLLETQIEQLATATARDQYEAGWISQDEAAQRGAGVEEADEEEPRGGQGAKQPEPQPAPTPEQIAAANEQAGAVADAAAAET